MLFQRTEPPSRRRVVPLAPPQPPVFYGFVTCQLGGKTGTFMGRASPLPPPAVLTFVLIWAYFSGTFCS